MKNLSPDEIMAKLGFPESENGPYVTKLREWIRSRSPANMSHGTWDTEYRMVSYEDHARRWLAFLWAAENRSYRVECIDGFPIRRLTRMGFKPDPSDPTCSIPTVEHRWEIKWRRIPAYVRDIYRKVKFNLRKKPLNPYEI